MIKLSKYTLFFTLDEHRGILYNTFNGRAIELSKKAYIKLGEGLTEPSFFEWFGNNAEFVYQSFCVLNGIGDEIVRDKLIQNKYSKERLIVTIMTTLNCNLSCVYCYQQGILDRTLELSESTAEQIRIWLINKLEEIQPKELICHFYGGEPLMNLDILDIIMKEVMLKCHEIGVRFLSYVTTNGTLLGYNNILRLKTWNVDNVQISVDGTADVHNQRRHFRNGDGSFETIMSNIEVALQNDINVVIRINIDKHNISNLHDLFLELKRRGLNKYPCLQINIELVSPIMNPSEHCKKYTFYTSEEMSTLIGLWEMQVNMGFPIKSNIPIDSACENMMENAYTISADGEIYMCAGFIGIEELKIGSVFTGIDKYKRDSLLAIHHWETCLNCEYVPVCQGGCKMCAFVTNHTFSSTYCRKDFISTIYPEFIRCKFIKDGIQ